MNLHARVSDRRPAAAAHALRHGVVAALAAGVLLAAGGCANLQEQLLYFPARARVEQMAGSGLRAWPSAQAFRGLVAEPPGGALATAIVFHGNAGHAGHRRHYAAALGPLGVRVILAEYPGYGPRDGSLGEESFVADAAQAIAQAHAQFGAPVVVIGESLGAAVAAGAAARQEPLVAGLMLLTPWARLEPLARYHYPLLPVQALMRDPYDSAARLAAFRRPVLVMVAEDDDIVPARFGAALHDGLAAPKRLNTVRGAGHNDWFGRVDAAWWRAAFDFVLAPVAR